jgi:hypothetical protein
MDTPTPLIVSVITPAYGRVVVEASDGMLYHADLTPLSQVYCFPSTKEAWDLVAPDSAGLALVWTTRFEVHIDQIQGLADRIEARRETA